MDLRGQDDVLPQILSYLPHQDVFRCLRVNRQFYTAITQNWSKMQKPTGYIQVQVQPRGFDVLLYFHENQNCTQGDRVAKGDHRLLITKAHIGFSLSLENLALQMLRERGEVSTQDMVLVLSINSETDGLREVLSYLFKRMRVTEFVLATKKTFLDPTTEGGLRYKYDPFTFSAEHLQCIFDVMKNVKIQEFKTEFIPICPNLLAIHTLADHITLSVPHIDFPLLCQLDTSKVIVIESEYAKFAPLGELLNEWYDGGRQIQGITAVSLLDYHRGLSEMRGVDSYDVIRQWLRQWPQNRYRMDGPSRSIVVTNTLGQQLSITVNPPKAGLHYAHTSITPRILA